MQSLSDHFSDLHVQKIKRRSRESTLVGFGSVVMGKLAKVRFTIRRRKAKDELCVNWPAHKSGNGKFYTDVEIQNPELQNALEETILAEFRTVSDEGPAESSQSE